MIVENIMRNWEISVKAGTPIGQLHHVKFDENNDSVKNEPSHISRMSSAKIDAIISEGKGDNSEGLDELTYKSTHLWESNQYIERAKIDQGNEGQNSKDIPPAMRIAYFKERLREDLVVSEEYREQVEEILLNNMDSFAFSNYELGRTKSITVNFDTGDITPVDTPQCRYPLHEHEKPE